MVKFFLLMAYQIAFAFGVGSLSWLAACDVAFAGNNAVVLAISLSSRFAAEAWSICLCKALLVRIYSQCLCMIGIVDRF